MLFRHTWISRHSHTGSLSGANTNRPSFLVSKISPTVLHFFFLLLQQRKSAGKCYANKF